MHLKMAADLAHLSEIVRSMMRWHTAMLARCTAHRFRRHGGDEENTVQRVSWLLELMEADLASDRREMLDNTVHELGGDVTAWTRRDEAAARLRQVYIREREEYALLYGREAALVAGFGRTTPRVPQRFLHQPPAREPRQDRGPGAARGRIPQSARAPGDHGPDQAPLCTSVSDDRWHQLEE